MKRPAPKLPSQVVLEGVSEFPSTRLVLATLAERAGAKDGSAVVTGLVGEGRLVMIGNKKMARYGTPAQARAIANPPKAKPKKVRILRG